MNHPSLLIERLTQERDEARAALAAAEQAARAAGEEYERSVQVINAAWLTLGKVVRDSVGQTPLIEVHELAELAVKLVERLEAFKAYVHRRLDEAGVPADPDSPHRAEGCRIGGRLDLVLARWAWVPVMERLPEEDGYTGQVLVARIVPYDPQFGDRDVTMAYRSNVGWRNDYGSVEQHGETVTHWMPLPAPPSPVAGEPGGAERSKA